MPLINEIKSITVKVPATTANLGPGFDALGMALDLWNTIHFSWSNVPRVSVHGEGEANIPADESNLTYQSALRLFREIGAEQHPMSIESWQDVPVSRGLGSSSCAIAGGLFGANALLGYPLSPHELLELAVEIEGHPDNVAPALMGGMSIAVSDSGTIHAAPVPVPDSLQCVTFIPDRPMSTKKARSVLGTNVTRADATFNLGRAALLVASFALDRPEYLRVATQDKMHQPQRQRVYREMKPIFDNAMKAGARGVFLSGAGSTIIAFTTRGENRAFTIGYEMADAADKLRLPGSIRVLNPSAIGAHVIGDGDNS